MLLVIALALTTVSDVRLAEPTDFALRQWTAALSGESLSLNVDVSLGDTGGAYGYAVPDQTRTDWYIVINPLIVDDKLLLATVILHEMGHALGLEHNENDSGAIMYPKIQSGKQPILDASDVSAVRSLYELSALELPPIMIHVKRVGYHRYEFRTQYRDFVLWTFGDGVEVMADRPQHFLKGRVRVQVRYLGLETSITRRW